LQNILFHFIFIILMSTVIYSNSFKLSVINVKDKEHVAELELNAVHNFKPNVGFDRTMMSPFCESAKMAALPLSKFPRSKTAPPLPETTAPVLTFLPSPFYKSHCSPRLWAAPSFPWPAGSLSLPLNLALWT
jgi:hypothetical protein